MTDQETPKISRYLLGDLPPEEMDALECRLLTESGLFELAESVESEVIDRYVRGELSPAEARRFERRLLPAERIRERVAFARALAARETARPDETGSRRAPVIPFFRAPARLAWAATLVASLAAGALGFEVVQLQDRAGELERARSAAVVQLEEARGRIESAPAPVEDRSARQVREQETARLAEELSAASERIAELEASEAATTERRIRQPGKISDGVATVSLVLSLTTRADSEPETLELGDAERVELQLDLGGQQPEGPVIARVLRENEPVWEIPASVEAFDGESMALLILPRKSLLEGRYKIKLVEGDAWHTGHPVGTYEVSFTP